MVYNIITIIRSGEFRSNYEMSWENAFEDINSFVMPVVSNFKEPVLHSMENYDGINYVFSVRQNIH